MNAIVSMFVRARRWQLYLLYAIGYVLFAAAMLGFLVSDGATHRRDWKLLLVVWICELPFVLGQVGWMWSVGVFLNSLLRPALQMPERFFRFSLASGVLCASTWPVLVFSASPVVTDVTITISVVALVCAFYAIEFLAKAMAMTHTGKLSIFPDHARYYFGVVVSPLSVWRLQPQLNQLYAEHPYFKLAAN